MLAPQRRAVGLKPVFLPIILMIVGWITPLAALAPTVVAAAIGAIAGSVPTIFAIVLPAFEAVTRTHGQHHWHQRRHLDGGYRFADGLRLCRKRGNTAGVGDGGEAGLTETEADGSDQQCRHEGEFHAVQLCDDSETGDHKKCCVRD